MSAARVSGEDKGNLTEGNKATSVKITDTESKLNYFDANNDGIVDEDELKLAAEDSIRAKELNKLFKQIIFALIILVFVLVGSLTFMTITVVELSKG